MSDMAAMRRQWAYAMAGDRIHRTQDYLDEWDRAMAAHDREVRAAVASEMREYIARDNTGTFVQGWNKALEVVAERIEEANR